MFPFQVYTGWCLRDSKCCAPLLHDLPCSTTCQIAPSALHHHVSSMHMQSIIRDSHSPLPGCLPLCMRCGLTIAEFSVLFVLQYAFNLFSHNSPMTENGYNEEEMKMVKETRKILGAPDMQVHSCPPAMHPAWLSSGTTLRSPILRLLWVENEREARAGRGSETISAREGLRESCGWDSRKSHCRTDTAKGLRDCRSRRRASGCPSCARTRSLSIWSLSGKSARRRPSRSWRPPTACPSSTTAPQTGASFHSSAIIHSTNTMLLHK